MSAPWPLAETEWTQRWEREFRRRRWIEHGHKFYPIGTRVEEIRPPPPVATWQRVNFTGAVFDTQRVLYRSGRDEYGRAMWLVRCALCGQERLLRSDVIRSGQVSACSCRGLPP